MKIKIAFFCSILFTFSVFTFAQNNELRPDVNSARQTISLQEIAAEMTNISKTVRELNVKMKNFSETFSSNQGLKLSERQQKLLVAFEFLNRAEQRLVSLQTLKLTLTEKQTALWLQLARINDDALPESIDRYVSTRGTTNAEQIRELRRRALFMERSELTGALFDISKSLAETNSEIRETELFLVNLRRRIFPQIEKELSDL